MPSHQSLKRAKSSWNRTIRRNDDGFAYSLYLSNLYEKLEEDRQIKQAEIKSQYPRGITKNGHFPFLLEQAIDGIGALLPSLQKPFLGYFHFFPPHDPYNTHRDFCGHFEDDGYEPISKPVDIFHDRNQPFDANNIRREYDEFILHVDREFGRLYEHLVENGFLDNTWLILTSDHGEMFERGLIGHDTPLLYEPLIRIPLMIFEPGRRTRTDVHVPTSTIDILPTLLHVTGQHSVDWTEGVVLPPFSNSYTSLNRSNYVLEAKHNDKNAPFTVATTALIKENFKLLYFFGYDELGPGGERIELFDLEKDPVELNNIYLTKPETGKYLLHEMKTKLAKVNAPYRQGL